MQRMQEFETAEMVVFGEDPPSEARLGEHGGRAGTSAGLAAPIDFTRRHVPLTIVAQDPSVTVPGGGDRPLTAVVDVPAEPLRAGPRGQRFFVVDFNAGTGAAAGPHVLTVSAAPRREQGWAVVDRFVDPSREQVLADGGFHAQKVYATCASLLAEFERVLGRRIPWNFGAHELYLVPHAFEGGNAGYSPDERSILFGYVPASGDGEPIFTCLSHDIIAHELTHAILDGLRPRYIEPGLPDQLAFHEGFADIVALLSVFGLADIVELALDPTTSTEREGRDEPPRYVDEARFALDRLKTNVLFGLAEQLGHSIDPGQRALRTALVDVPVGGLWRTDRAFEVAHRRGEVLVVAVCQAVAELWHNRLHDIRRYGKVPLRRAAEEGAKVAGQVLGMCIRALDYLPPIDFDFGDFVDAILAADEVVAPDDKLHYRDVVAKAFAMYDIHPPERTTTTPKHLKHPWRFEGINLRALATSADEVFRFIWQNADNFDIDLDLHLHVERVLAATRTGPDGLVVEEIIADYTQTVSAVLGDLPAQTRTGVDVPANTEVQIWGGGVIVFDQYGRPRHHVTKNILRTAEDRERQRLRLAYLAANGILDTRNRLGFSAGQSDTARFRMLHDDEFLPSERW